MGRDKPAKLEFSPWLNALVGGRGTGKSTVIHAMRLAARRGHQLEHLGEHSEPRSTFRRFEQVPKHRTDQGGLTESTNIVWTMMRDGVRYRLHWRQDGSVTTVEEDTGEAGWRPSPAQTVTPERFPVRMFSQGQIAALAGEDQRALLQVIDEAAGVAALQRDLEETRKAFYAAKARIRELEGRLARRDDLAVEQRDVEHKLKRFEEAEHTAILTAYRHRNRQRTEADRQFDMAKGTADRIEQAAAALQPEDLPDGLFHETSKEDRQITAIMAALATGVRDAAQDLRHVAERPAPIDRDATRGVGRERMASGGRARGGRVRGTDRDAAQGRRRRSERVRPLGAGAATARRRTGPSGFDAERNSRNSSRSVSEVSSSKFYGSQTGNESIRRDRILERIAWRRMKFVRIQSIRSLWRRSASCRTFLA